MLCHVTCLCGEIEIVCVCACGWVGGWGRVVTAAVGVQSCPLFLSCAVSAHPQAPLRPLVTGECGFPYLGLKKVLM